MGLGLAGNDRVVHAFADQFKGYADHRLSNSLLRSEVIAGWVALLNFFEAYGYSLHSEVSSIRDALISDGRIKRDVLSSVLLALRSALDNTSPEYNGGTAPLLQKLNEAETDDVRQFAFDIFCEIYKLREAPVKKPE